MTVTPRQQSETVLDRLADLHPRLIDLSLDRTLRLLDAVGNPQKRLPPVIHVAGTNGKGSTVAFLRSIAEAAGLAVHTYTSPHLIRFHERICLTGRPISETELLRVLDICETANGGDRITLFEVTTVAAFLAFSQHPADLLVLETGLGGRLDSTNVLPAPSVTVITPVSVDHTGFLGDTLAQIAFEKAGILKAGVPCVTAPQPEDAFRVIEKQAETVGAPLLAAGLDWTVSATRNGVTFRDSAGELILPRPSLRGPHQAINAGTAIAAARCWRPQLLDGTALATGLLHAAWPGRFQQISLASLAPATDCEVWLDGGHNPAAGAALSECLAELPHRQPTVLVCAMQSNKDAGRYLEPLARVAGRLVAVPLPGSGSGMDPDRLAALARNAGLESATAPSIMDGLAAASRPGARIVICGSLYLAGEVLRLSGEGD